MQKMRTIRALVDQPAYNQRSSVDPHCYMLQEVVKHVGGVYISSVAASSALSILCISMEILYRFTERQQCLITSTTGYCWSTVCGGNSQHGIPGRHSSYSYCLQILPLPFFGQKHNALWYDILIKSM